MRIRSAFVGLTASPPIPRSFAAGTLPSTSDQLLPPFVDLYSPSPASFSLAPFGSPVPTQSVFPVRSAGSIRSVPIEVVSRPLEISFQFARSARAFPVIQTPPPAAPM